MRQPLAEPAPQARPHLEEVVRPQSGVHRPPLLRLDRAVIIGTVAGALLIRGLFVFASGFPLNDGGLFYAMTRDLQAAGYRLPEYTSYNGAHIPFAYPPLGFYIAGALADLTGMSLVNVFRYLPLALSMLALLAFVRFSRRMLSSPIEVATSAWVFALLPPAFLWMIMGGGVTRALGFVFAILTLDQVVVMYRDRRVARSLAVGTLAGLTLLSHLEMAWFVAFSSGLFFIVWGRQRAGISATLVAACTALAVSAPWWLTVLLRFGPSPFVAAARSGTQSPIEPLWLLAKFNPASEHEFAVLGALGLLGVLACLARRQYLLPAWLLLALLLDPRAFPTSAVLPLALLVTLALHCVLLPVATGTFVAGAAAPSRRAPRWLPAAALASIAAYALFSAFTSAPSLLTGMTPAERQAMSWVARNTPPDARVVVVSGADWPTDRTSEWFPVLTGRQSVATVQGYEWLTAAGGFSARVSAYRALQDCANADGSCVERWAVRHDAPFDYLYIPVGAPSGNLATETPCCGAIEAALRDDSHFVRVYDGSGAVIYRRRS
ncbi:MAG: hypothetical protein KGK07_08335 [Chloroflexota bacterium]|nr:hypothetical protein [Chloroflexota bacterium]